MQDFAFKLQHRPGAANRVAGALSRNPLQQTEQIYESSDKALLAAFVAQAEKCQSCWGQARTFLTRGGEGNAIASPTHHFLLQRANEIVQKETQLPERESRMTEEAGTNTIRECQKLCPETIAIRQYVEQVPGAALPKWAVVAGLKPKVRDGILLQYREGFRRATRPNLCACDHENSVNTADTCRCTIRTCRV